MKTLLCWNFVYESKITELEPIFKQITKSREPCKLWVSTKKSDLVSSNRREHAKSQIDLSKLYGSAASPRRLTPWFAGQIRFERQNVLTRRILNNRISITRRRFLWSFSRATFVLLLLRWNRDYGTFPRTCTRNSSRITAARNHDYQRIVRKKRKSRFREHVIWFCSFCSFIQVFLGRALSPMKLKGNFRFSAFNWLCVLSSPSTLKHFTLASNLLKLYCIPSFIIPFRGNN